MKSRRELIDRHCPTSKTGGALPPHDKKTGTDRHVAHHETRDTSTFFAQTMALDHPLDRFAIDAGFLSSVAQVPLMALEEIAKEAALE